MKALFSDIDGGAELSTDRVYRYLLWRRWGDGPSMTFIGVNPSTADESNDDQTIKKCMGFAKRNGCEAIQMLNLFAFRARDPKVMKSHPSPIGELNDDILLQYSLESKAVVACWGGDGRHLGRDQVVTKMLQDAEVCLKCFGRTQLGHPRHPVMLPYATQLVDF